MLSPLKKWAISSLLFLTVLTVAIYLLFVNEIDQMLGGNTEVVNVTQFKSVSGQITIHNVHVLSTDSSEMRGNQLILINGNRIEYVGSLETMPNRDLVLKSYYQVGRVGRFVIPGLIDSHVHVKKK